MLFHYLSRHQNAESELSDLMQEAWEKEVVDRDDSVDSSNALSELWGKIEQKKVKTVQHFRLLKYAASLVAICSAVLIYKISQKKQPEPAKLLTIVTKTTTHGEKVKITLPDSSIVYLGSLSKISWPDRFEKGKVRSVSLEGEAFFEIKHDAARPFVIRSGKMETQVLGTSFTIYAYPRDQVFTVTVRTGKVGVTEKSRGKSKLLSLLTPGMKIAYDNHSGVYKINTNHFDEADSWIKNRFVFRDEDLASMLIRLERYYNVRFELKNPALKTCRFNATFSDISIGEVLNQLKVMSGGHIRYKVNSDKTKIILWGEVCE